MLPQWLDVGKEIQRESIAEVEEVFGVNFPADYIDCVLSLLQNGFLVQ